MAESVGYDKFKELEKIFRIRNGKGGLEDVRKKLEEIGSYMSPHQRDLGAFLAQRFRYSHYSPRAGGAGGGARARTHTSFRFSHLAGRIEGTALVLAVIHAQRDVIKHLVVEQGANVNEVSSRTWGKGRRQYVVEEPALFHAVVRGDLWIVRTLVEHRADLEKDTELINQRSQTLQCTSVFWEACHQGHGDVVRYLLEDPAFRGRKAGWLERQGTSLETPHIACTPLHIATYNNHYGVVLHLIEHRARIDVFNSMLDSSPIEDAIEMKHCEVLRKLVQHHEEEDQTFSAPRMEKLFRQMDSATVDAYAEGVRLRLERRPGTFANQMCLEQKLVPFFRMGIDAPCHILETLFQRCTLHYWECRECDTGVRMRLKEPKTATFTGSRFICTARGPDWADLEHDFQHFEPPKGAARLFFRRLVPQLPHRMQEPVDVYQCVARGFHADPRVVAAIAAVRDDRCLANPKCIAIINNAWEETHGLFLLSFLLSAAHALAYFCTTTLRVFAPGPPGGESHLLFGLLVSFEAVFLCRELLQLASARHLGLLRDCWHGITGAAKLLDLLGIGLGAASLVLLYLSDAPFRGTPVVLRVVCGLAALAKWMKVLGCFGCLDSLDVGRSIVPLTSTVYDSMPFGIVVFFVFLGWAHAYQMLGLEDAPEVWVFSVFRLTFKGEEAEGAAAAGTEMYYVYNVMLVLTTILVSLTLINLFISVLSENYRQSSEKRDMLFMKLRARWARDQVVLRTVLRHFRDQLGCGGGGRKEDGDDDDDAQAAGVPSGKSRHRHDESPYLWYSTKRRDHPASDHEQAPAQQRAPPESVEEARADAASADDMLQQRLAGAEQAAAQAESSAKHVAGQLQEMSRWLQEQHDSATLERLTQMPREQQILEHALKQQHVLQEGHRRLWEELFRQRLVDTSWGDAWSKVLQESQDPLSISVEGSDPVQSQLQQLSNEQRVLASMQDMVTMHLRQLQQQGQASSSSFAAAAPQPPPEPSPAFDFRRLQMIQRRAGQALSEPM